MNYTAKCSNRCFLDFLSIALRKEQRLSHSHQFGNIALPEPVFYQAAQKKKKPGYKIREIDKFSIA
jgi:hypothetical protein